MKRNSHLIRKILFLIIGNFGFAIAFNCFYAGNDIAAGGFGGLGLIVSSYLPISIGLFVMIISIPVFIWSYFVHGLKYTLSALASTVAFSLFTDIFSFLPTVTDNRLLAALCGGAIYGIFGSLLVRGYVAGSGTDLLARLLVTKFRSVSLGTILFSCDVIVVTLAAICFGDFESGIYAAVALLVSSYVMDAVIRGFNRAVVFQIITVGPADELAQAVIGMKRGVTMLKAVGIYEQKDKDMLMVAVKPKEIYVLKDLIREKAPGAFVMMLPASEVIGQGFKGVDVTVPIKDIGDDSRI